MRQIAALMQQVRDAAHLVKTHASQFVTATKDRTRGVIDSFEGWITSWLTTLRNLTQRMRRHLRSTFLLLPIRARSHFIRRRVIYVRISAVMALFLTMIACWAGMEEWHIASQYLGHLNRGIFEQVPLALGTSIAGLLAIVFALTTFAIQQVAAREAAEIVQEYASDPTMASTYWCLAIIAIICFAVVFVHPTQDFLPTEVISFAVLLILALLLIYRHFKIVMLYSDPRFTVDRLLKRGLRELRTVYRTVDRVRRAMNDS